MLLWPPLTGTQLSPVAPQSWVLLKDHTPGNHHDRRAKPGEGLRCCECLHTQYACSLALPSRLYPPTCPSPSCLLPVHCPCSPPSPFALPSSSTVEKVLRAPPYPDQYLLLSPDTAEGDPDNLRSRRWHLLDYLLVRRRDHQDVQVTKAILGAEGCTDNRLVISMMRLRLQPRRRPLANFPVADEDTFEENRRCQLRDMVQSAALGRARRQQQDWC
ncbi:unnamed protein product [Schistocephalus solidus]|uniref:TGFb_propeptide domain-containing protein n=1 Tax=Schistocephalus solidus TaxID=70667 RepID=A0A183SL63_SCHSO|nr:unnamed protein product [Schistocephalus solidus]